MSAIDHPDAPWYHPTFLGPGGTVGVRGLEAKDQWTSITNAGAVRPGHAAFRIGRQPQGATQLHYVNAIDPGTAGDWLLPDVQLDGVEPARRAF